MASITSLSNSSYSSSIYGNRNVLSGLASGMDTESMIENAVSGIKLKIQNLQKKRTKIEWQQEAYRSIIDKAVNFNTKYTSYSSKTNLLSSSFFSNAVNTTTAGTYKDKVTASGKTSSDIKLNAVKQLATAAAYTVSGLGGQFAGEIGGITGEKFDIADTIPVSTVSGSLTFQYGGTNGASFDIKFDELEDLNDVVVYDDKGAVVEDPSSTSKLAQAIKNKLSEITYNYTKNGFQETTTADKAIKVNVDATGVISFEDGLGNGNSVKISSSSGEIDKYAGDTVIRFGDKLTADTPVKDYLEDKELGITFNGTTKKISMNDVLKNVDFTYDATEDKNTQFKNALQKELDDAFGKGKIEVGRDGEGKLSFTPAGEGDTLSLGGSAIEALGFESGDSNFINTGKKLSDLLGDDVFKDENKLMGVGKAKLSSNGKYYVDEKGNRVNKDGVRLNGDGEEMYKFTVNGADINVTKGTTLEGLMNAINSNAEAGVKVSYSKLTNEFKFTATETGENSKIEFGGLAEDMFGNTVSKDTHIRDILGSGYAGNNYGAGKFSVKIGDQTISAGVTKGSAEQGNGTTLQGLADNLTAAFKKTDGYEGYTASYDEQTNSLVVKDKDGNQVDFEYGDGIAKDLFGKIEKDYTKGQDAVMDVTINGKRFENLTRSGNSFDIDGLTVNVKGTFNEDGSGIDKDGNAIEPVTFETATDSDKIVDAIKSFVDDYNEMITEIKNAYSTLPAEKSNGARYEPLTAEQEDEYSESELKAYNEKAKQGILFGDTTLSSMYSKMLNAIQPGGTDGQALREIGIGTSYSSGLTTISLDEDKLRAALDSDPDKVKNAFTKTREGGSASNGLMQTMQDTLNTYVKSTGEPKGVLIQRAGSVKSPTSLNSNSLKSQMDRIDSQIDRWTDKMADQIDRYTTQFSRLEQLIAEMNSQASAMSGLMGGSSGY